MLLKKSSTIPFGKPPTTSVSSSNHYGVITHNEESDSVDFHDISGRYTVRCNRADIAVGVSSYNDIEP